MVGAIGFEPTTPCAQGLDARTINNLRLVVTDRDGVLPKPRQMRLPAHSGKRFRHSVALGKVGWWAQKWTQFFVAFSSHLLALKSGFRCGEQR